MKLRYKRNYFHHFREINYRILMLLIDFYFRVIFLLQYFYIFISLTKLSKTINFFSSYMKNIENLE